MTWWMWALGGLFLLGIEVATPGSFFTLFFGVAALVVAGLALFGLAGPDWVQWLLFSLGSVGSLVLFRQKLLRRSFGGGAHAPGTVVGEVAVLQEDLAPGQVGRAELRGTVWSARHDGPAALARGQRCRVVRIEGLTLWLRAE
ncbi:MAG: NfeD family protein [bacterium]|nr:NfeD family protein [bacterium]